jgi:hypothetical protein
LGRVLSPPLPLGTVESLLAGNFLDESRHPYTLCDEACSRMMHGNEKLAASSVNTCDLSHVDLDFFARARLRAPNIFRFVNPGSAKSAGEFQATLAAILMYCDS